MQRADVLVGRDRELQILADALDTARAGRRAVVLVEGEAGMGKTALVRSGLSVDAATLLWASGDEAETRIDCGVADQLARAAPLSDDVRTELLSVSGDPIAVGGAMVRVLDGLRLDPGRPLVVVVDEAQWADRVSLEALAFAARRLPRDPVVLCLVARSEGFGAFPDSVRRLVVDEGQRVSVGPLDQPAVRRLVERSIGRGVSPSAVARLHEHTGGSPLHLGALLQELPPSAVASATNLPPPRSYRALIVSELAACEPGVEALVAAVAVLGDVGTFTLAADLAGIAEPDVALDVAIGRGLLEAERAGEGKSLRVACTHPMARSAVLESLAPGRLADLHRRAGEMLGGARGLRHRLLGARGSDAELWQEALEEGRREGVQGLHGAAAALLALAAPLAPTPAARVDTVLEAVDQMLHAGHIDDAVELLGTVGRGVGGHGARHSYVQGRLAFVSGPRRDAAAHLGAAWDALVGGGEPGRVVPRGLPEDDRDLAGRIAAALATVSVDRARGDDAIDWCRRAIALAPLQAAQSSASHMLAGAYALTDRFDEGLREFDALCEDIRRTRVRTHPPVIADAHSGRGLLRLWSNDLPGAAEDLAMALSAADEGGSIAARESARYYLAEVFVRQGRWDDAILLAQLSASLVDDSGQEWMAALPHAVVAGPLAARGEPTAQHHIERSLAAAAAVGMGVASALSTVAALEVAACARDHVAVVGLGRSLRDDPRRRVDERIAPWRASFVEALVLAELVDEAAVTAEALASAPATDVVRSDAARAMVAVAAARGDDDGMERAAGAGLALDPASVGPYRRACLELAIGRAWRRRGDRRRAVEVLTAGRERFESLGARPWVEQVDRELAASGLRPRGRKSRSGPVLTPQEHAVAQLVIRGLTNREVASELVVSAKTVEHHLSRTYAKLGVRSRTELASALLSS